MNDILKYMILSTPITVAVLIWLSCILLLVFKKKHGYGVYFLCGLSLQILLALPAGIWQGIFGWQGSSMSGAPWWERTILPLISWFFNAGGFTVRFVFEVTVEPLEWLVGHRSSTVISNLPYFLFLLAIQCIIVAGFFAWRYKKVRTLKDPYLFFWGLLFLINSLLNVRWFWAGS